VTFESGSRLERIDEHAFCASGLQSIVIPSSVVALGKSSFSSCWRLESVVFESGSRLERIDEFAFSGSRASFSFVADSLAASQSRTAKEAMPTHEHLKTQ
jgi:hypothetical protein